MLAGVAFGAAHPRERPAEIGLLLGLTLIAVRLVAVGIPLIATFGLWLVHLGNSGYGSVDASIDLLVVALALGRLGGHRPKQARRLATELARVQRAGRG